jgi:hypothetical protein
MGILRMLDHGCLRFQHDVDGRDRILRRACPLAPGTIKKTGMFDLAD